MSNGSAALIDRCIAQLESLSGFLTDEVQRPWTIALLQVLSDAIVNTVSSMLQSEQFQKALSGS